MGATSAWIFCKRSLVSALFRLENCILVDAKAVAIKARVPVAQNMAVLGAATPFLPFELSDFAPFVTRLFEEKGENIVNANLLALEMGCKLGQFSKELLAHKVPGALVYLLVSKFDPATVDPALAPRFANALLADPQAAEARLASMQEAQPCTAETLERLAAG